MNCSKDEAVLVIQTLKQKKIFDYEELKDGHLRIISRKQKKMENLSKIRKNAGELGGNPNLVNQNGNQIDKLNPEYETTNKNEIKVQDRGVGEELVYDAEKEISKNQIWFEQVCMSSGKNIEDGKESLRKFHLYMEENSKYPRTKRAICAGFEKWLLNEKKINGNTTHQRTSQNGSGKKGTSDARIDALRNW